MWLVDNVGRRGSLSADWCGASMRVGRGQGAGYGRRVVAWCHMLSLCGAQASDPLTGSVQAVKREAGVKIGVDWRKTGAGVCK